MAVRLGIEDTLQRRVKDKIRNEFGKRTSQEVVSGIRDGLMEALKNSLGEDAGELGVQIVDFRVKRIDFEKAKNIGFGKNEN